MCFSYYCHWTCTFFTPFTLHFLMLRILYKPLLLRIYFSESFLYTKFWFEMCIVE